MVEQYKTVAGKPVMKDDIKVYIAYGHYSAFPTEILKNIDGEIKVYNKNNYTLASIMENAKDKCVSVIIVQNPISTADRLLELDIEPIMVNFKPYRLIKREEKAREFTEKGKKQGFWHKMKEWLRL